MDVALRYVSSIEKLNGSDHFFSFEQHLLLLSSLYLYKWEWTNPGQTSSPLVKPKRIWSLFRVCEISNQRQRRHRNGFAQGPGNRFLQFRRRFQVFLFPILAAVLLLHNFGLILILTSIFILIAAKRFVRSAWVSKSCFSNSESLSRPLNWTKKVSPLFFRLCIFGILFCLWICVKTFPNLFNISFFTLIGFDWDYASFFFLSFADVYCSWHLVPRFCLFLLKLVGVMEVVSTDMVL